MIFITNTFCAIFVFFTINSVIPTVINPRTLKNYSGYEEFIQGVEAFEKQDFLNAKKYFFASLKKAPKIYYRDIFWDNSHMDMGWPWNENDLSVGPEDINTYFIWNDLQYEISYALARHCNFYLGLINLNLLEVKKANMYFTRALGFGTEQKHMGLWYFKIINIMNPYWIGLISQTLLFLKDQESANNYCNDYNFMTLSELDMARNILNKYDDFIDEKLFHPKRYWFTTQKIIYYNNFALILKNESNIKDAIYYSSIAIDISQNCPNSEINELSTLYSNRGFLYLEINDYYNSLLDFDISISINSNNSDNYINRAFVNMILGNYQKAIIDYNTAINIEPYNSEFFKLRALAHYLNFSSEKCKSDKEAAYSLDQMDENEYFANLISDDNPDNEIYPNDWLIILPIKKASIIISANNDEKFVARLASKSYIEVLEILLPTLETRRKY